MARGGPSSLKSLVDAVMRDLERKKKATKKKATKKRAVKKKTAKRGTR